MRRDRAVKSDASNARSPANDAWRADSASLSYIPSPLTASLPPVPRVPRTRLLPALALVLAACSSNKSAARDAASTPARVVASEARVSCDEWVRRAQAQPELDVERVPEPVAYDPPPLPKRLPRGTVGKDGKAEVRVKVLVDTLGKADMSTFTVVKTTHPRLAASVKAAVAKWSFHPAEVGGCKVPRIFNWAAVAGGAAGDAASPKKSS